MTLNINLDPLQTLSALIPNPQQAIGTAQQLQGLQSNALNLQAQQQQLQGQQAQIDAITQERNVLNTRNNFIRLENMIQRGAQPDELEAILRQNITNAESSGGNPIDSIQALNALRAGGPAELAGFMNKSRPAFEQLGLLPQAQRGQIDFAKVDVAKFTPDSIRLAQQTGNYGDLQLREGAEPPPKYIDELRGELRKSVGGLEEEARSLTSNFQKLSGLADEIANGNRTAVAQGMVALLKLGDPTSVAREAEVEAALATQNPLGAVMNVFRGSGASEDVIQSVVAQIDPLNPQNVNKNSLLSTAQAMLQPNAQQIAEQYQRSKQRATNQLSEGGVRSIFDEQRDEFFYALPGLSFDLSEPEETQESQEVQQSTMTRQQARETIDSILQGL